MQFAAGNTVSSWTQNWVSIDETSKPSLLRISSTRPSSMRPSSMTTESFPYTYFNKQGQSSNHYYYQVSTETPGTTYSSPSSGSGGSSTYLSSRLPLYTTGTFPGSSSLTTRPTTNPPAPTVIVLGPLGTEYTTSSSHKPSTRRPATTIKTTINTNQTKKPVVSTTITHNISTVISGATLNNKHVVSTSYISVNLKDGTTSIKPSTIKDYASSTETGISSVKQPSWTTVSTWVNKKPSFHLKPSFDANKNATKTPVTSTASPYEEETAAPDDSIIFPPVRHPELNISNAVVQQEKPTLVLKGNDTDYPDNFIVGDIPTPSFIEDDVLKNKVDSFVNKIVDSLQGNFEELKDVVYSKTNTTASSPTKISSTTKKPTSITTKKPKPAQVTVKKPVPPRRPTTTRPSTAASGRPTTLKSKPTLGQTITTKKATVTTKRPKPTKKITTVPSTEVVTSEDVSSTISEGSLTTTKIPDLNSATDHQRGISFY